MATVKITRSEITAMMDYAGVYADKITAHRDGSFTARFGFYYRHGQNAQRKAEQIEAMDCRIVIDDAREHYNQWPRDSYWAVEFHMDDTHRNGHGDPLVAEPRECPACGNGPVKIELAGDIGECAECGEWFARAEMGDLPAYTGPAPDELRPAPIRIVKARANTQAQAASTSEAVIRLAGDLVTADRRALGGDFTGVAPWGSHPLDRIADLAEPGLPCPECGAALHQRPNGSAYCGDCGVILTADDYDDLTTWPACPACSGNGAEYTEQGQPGACHLCGGTGYAPAEPAPVPAPKERALVSFIQVGEPGTFTVYFKGAGRLPETYPLDDATAQALTRMARRMQFDPVVHENGTVTGFIWPTWTGPLTEL